MSAEPDDTAVPVTVAGRLSTYLRGGGIITPIITVIFAFIVVVIGGLVSSTLLTLILLPILYRRFGHAGSAAKPPATP